MDPEVDPVGLRAAGGGSGADAPAAPGCGWVEERLPLLLAPDGLEPDERVLVLAHLEGCAGCRVVEAEVEAARAALDRVPLRHPAAARWAGLRGRVLAAVGAAPGDAGADGPADAGGCPEEAALLDRAGLDAAAGAALDAHLTGCAPCRAADAAFSGVAQALDLAPPPPLDAARRAALRAAVLERVLERAGAGAARESGVTAVGAPPAQASAGHAPGADAPAARAPAGRLLRPWATTLRAAAAALLVAAGLGLGALAARPARLDAAEAVALKRAADEVVRAHDRPGWAVVALEAYEQVVARGRADEPLAARAIDEARRELPALRALAVADAVAAPEARQAALEAVLVEHPGARATFLCALDRWGAQVKRQVQAAARPADGAAPGPGAPGAPPLRWDVRIRYDEVSHLSQELVQWLTDPRVKQAIHVQEGLLLEDLGQLAQARARYREALALGRDSPAAELARRRLEALGEG